jgi:hypothetical protein
MRFIMNFFRRKMAKCVSCKRKVPEKKMWEVAMNTAEGKHSIKVCETCAQILDDIKDSHAKQC